MTKDKQRSLENKTGGAGRQGVLPFSGSPTQQQPGRLLMKAIIVPEADCVRSFVIYRWVGWRERTVGS